MRLSALQQVEFFYNLAASFVFFCGGIAWPKHLRGEKIVKTILWALGVVGFGLALAQLT